MTTRDDEDLALDDELRAQLGLDDDDAPPAMELPALDSLKARIHRDLDEKQGSFRDAAPAARVWPVALALVLGAAFVVALSPATLGGLSLASVVVAGLAATLAIAGIALSPSRPGLGERVALAGLVVGGVALALQVAGGLGGHAPLGDALVGSAKCSAVMFVGAGVPLIVLAAWVRRSGLPLRALHATGLAVSAFALASVGVFRHCAPVETWHTLFAHLAAPALGVAAAAALLYRLLQRRLT